MAFSLRRRVSDLLLVNSIPTTQNQVDALQQLAAQRHLYSFAKKLFIVQLILAGPVAIAWAFGVILRPELKSWAALFGLIVALTDVVLLTPWQKRLRDHAARIQEAFDCDVLELPWNSIKVGHRPDPELVKEHADAYSQIASRFSPLTDWYPPIVGDLPLSVARVICQRTNCWWDSKQRRRYAVSILVVTGVITAAITAIAVAGDFSVNDLLLAIVAPLAPTFVLAFRQASEHSEAANRLDKLKAHAERLWTDTSSGNSPPHVAAETRSLQDEIFENRKRSPFVFDWIFMRLRKDYEAQMNHGAGQLVADAKKRLGLP